MPPQENYRQRIRDIRPFSRPNPDGSRSTVLLEQADNYAYPTLFPVDPNNPEAGWIELKGDEAFKEAEERDEVFEFGSEKEAMKFAEGSWKHLEEKPTSKSIDDIINTSSLSEALSAAVSDKTNVEIKSAPKTLPRQYEMSSMPERQIEAPGLGPLLEAINPLKAGSFIAAGTPRFKNLIQVLSKAKPKEILMKSNYKRLLDDITEQGYPKEHTLANIKNISKADDPGTADAIRILLESIK